jgi:hypothetical protein
MSKKKRPKTDDRRLTTSGTRNPEPRTKNELPPSHPSLVSRHPITTYPPQSLEEFLNNIILATNTPAIKLDDITHAVANDFHAPPIELEDAIVQCLEMNQHIFIDYERKLCETRASVFQGAQFILAPLPEELEQGFLVPGHRFIPFTRIDLHPTNCIVSIADGTSTSAIPWRAVTLSFSDAQIYFTLLGKERMADYLIGDYTDNRHALLEESEQNAQIILSALDLRDIKKQWNVKQGDAFRCTVTDWEKGCFTLEHAPAGTWNAPTITKNWIQHLETILTQVNEEEMVVNSIYEQLARCYYQGGDLLLKNPPIHIGGFVATSNTFSIHPILNSVCFFPRGTDVEAVILAQMLNLNDIGPVGRLDTIEAITNDIGLSLDMDELKAIIHASLSAGACTPESIFDHVMGPREEYLTESDVQLNALKQHLSTLIDHERASFDPVKDKRRAPLRRKLLDMREKTINWLRECDAQGISPDEMPPDLTAQLGHISAMVSHILSILVDEEPPTKTELNDLRSFTPQIEAELDATLGALQNALAPQTMRVLTSPTHVYQLKIALKYIKPPIWRRVLVLDNTFLDDLHDVIQCTMGWEDYHLHGFEHKGKRYEPDTDDDFFGLSVAEPEENVELRTLLKKEKDKLTYTYDYGDNWTHTITLEKILPIDPEATYPTCIKGKRACPPEDCGGPCGYAHLLEVLADPNHERHEELSSWIGDHYAPEHINLDEINQHLL